MQKGRIYRRGRSWILGYSVREFQPDGKTAWVNRSKKLAPVCDDYRTEASVRHLAMEVLGPVNTKTARPESTDTVEHYLEHVYLPYCKANLKPSTHAGYTFLFKMIKPHLGHYRLRDFGAVEGERLLNDFANEKRRAHTMLKNMKGFLSGAFRYAVRTGTIRFNPMRETMLPKNGKPMQTQVPYTLKQIQEMVKVLEEPARTAVFVAALTGLRMSEIRGLKWEDYDGEVIHVRRAVWRTHVGTTKTPGSAGGIPVIPVLADALELFRKVSPGPYIFQGKTGKPMVLANVATRQIVGKVAGWHGWPGFRRGIATTLYELGVPDKVIQEILRHSDVAVTMKHYVKTNMKQSKAAMRKLSTAFERTGKRTGNRTH
jgi:integrase